MNERHLRARAEAESLGLLGNGATIVRVAAQGGNEKADSCVSIFKEWAARHTSPVVVIRTGSMGYDDLEPVALIESPGNPDICYSRLDEKVSNQLIRELTTGNNLSLRVDAALAAELPWVKLQKRIALRNCGLVDPESISHYITSCQGYGGLAKVVKLSRTEVINEIDKAELREKTGCGCPTVRQWKAMYENESSEKIVVCSMIENDIQFRTARLIGEGDPHAVLEGLLISAYAAGATRCIVAIPECCSELKARITNAVGQAREYGLIGNNILDSGFTCEVEVRDVPNSTVLSEEAALLSCLENRQAVPGLRTRENSLPASSGKAFLVHFIETLANISAVFQKGAEFLNQSGTKDSKGTKVISLCGDVPHRYTIEVPFGITLESVLREIGGSDLHLKAVQFGGPTASFLGTTELSLPVAFESLNKAGASLGFGMIHAVSEGTCAVELAEQQMKFLHGHSCGKCVFLQGGDASYGPYAWRYRQF